MALRPPERLELPGLLLRRETPGDADLIATVVAANLEHLAPWMPWAVPAAGTAATQRQRLDAGVAGWDAGEDCGFLLLDPGGALLGILGFHRRIGPGGVELGYWLAAGAVGHGHVTSAARALTNAALALADVDRVEVHTDVANVRSAAVPRRIGYRLDRTERRPPEAPAETDERQVWVTTAPV